MIGTLQIHYAGFRSQLLAVHKRCICNQWRQLAHSLPHVVLRAVRLSLARFHCALLLYPVQSKFEAILLRFHLTTLRILRTPEISALRPGTPESRWKASRLTIGSATRCYHVIGEVRLSPLLQGLCAVSEHVTLHRIQQQGTVEAC